MTKKKKIRNVDFDRRKFLKTAAVTAAIATTGAIAPMAPVKANSKRKDTKKSRAKKPESIRVIDLEAHFTTAEFTRFLGKYNSRWGNNNPVLFDLGEGRLKNMDAAGVDMQVLSLWEPGVQQVESSEGVAWSKKLNDQLADAVNRHPDRLAGMASVAPQSPEEAANELERAVTQLGLRGLMLNSNARDEYFDEKKFWPIFEKAEELDVPIYLHPGGPAAAIAKGYEGYGFAFSAGALGWGAEVTLCASRLIYSGLFDKYPTLKIVLGHMGEGLPFLLHRLDFPWLLEAGPPSSSMSESESGSRNALAPDRPDTLMKASDYFKRNFYVTNSGVCYEPAFVCAYMVLGADHMAFACDYPVENTKKAVDWTKSLPISDTDKERICYLTAKKLYKL